MSDRASTILAWAARRIAVLQAPSCPLSIADVRFEMRRVAAAMEGCADEVRDLELRGIGRTRREDEALSGPWIDHLAATIGGILPAATEPQRRLIIGAVLRAVRAPTTAMVVAGAAELAPYATTPAEIAAAVRRARDAWTAMVDRARQTAETAR